MLREMPHMTVSDIRNIEQVSKVLLSTLTPKLMGYAPYFAEQIGKLCIQALPRNTKNFDPEYIRVCKILGSNIFDSYVLQGMVVGRKAEGSINRVTKPRIAVYACPLDTQQSDTKGTVLLKSAKELMNYTKSEEEHAERVVRSIADSGVK